MTARLAPRPRRHRPRMLELAERSTDRRNAASAPDPRAHRTCARPTTGRLARPRRRHRRVCLLQTTWPPAAPTPLHDRRRPAPRTPAPPTSKHDGCRETCSRKAAAQPLDRTHRLVRDATDAARQRTRTPSRNASAARGAGCARKRPPRDYRRFRPRRFT